MALLKNRPKRHASFVQFDDNLMNCFLPDGLFQMNETCQYVTNHPTCSDPVFLFNYLSITVCCLGLDSKLLGDIAVVVIFTLVIFLLSWLIYMLTKYFLIPNTLTVGKQLRMSNIEYGLFVSFMLTAPEAVYGLKLCQRLPESSTVLFAEGIGNALGCFCIGIVITSAKMPFRVTIWYSLFNLLLLLSGTVTLELLMHSKYTREYRVTNAKPIEFWGYALGYVAAYLLYVVTIVAVMRCCHANAFESRSKNDEAIAQLADLTRTYPAMMRAAVGMRLHAPQQPGSMDDLQPSASGPHHPHSHREGGLYVWRSLAFSLLPFQNMKANRWFQICCTPVWFVFALLIPVIDENRLLHSWCKPLVCLSFLMMPLYLWLVYPSIYMVPVIAGLGVVLFLLVLCLTRATQLPKAHAVFVVPGLLMALSLFFVLNKEVDAILMQLLGYVSNWKADAIPMVAYLFGDAVAEILVCWELTKSGNQEASLAISYGMTMFSLYATLPQMIMEPCPSEPNTVVMTAITRTGFIFLLLLICGMFFALVHTDFELRFSFGLFMLSMYFMFVLFVALVESNQIHAYGSQHASKILPENKPSEWT